MSEIFYTGFSVAGISYMISSNIDIENYLFDPQPFNLNLNYLLEKYEGNDPDFEININSNTSKLEVSLSSNKLSIYGDITPMFSDEYNLQFGLFGNKGLIHKFILHTLEIHKGITALHASSVIDPSRKKVCIAIGSSGSGKSVFTSNALRIGWELIATEQVLLDSSMVIFKGNNFDNNSPQAISFVKENLQKAIIHEDKKLREPIGSKVFIDLSKYSMQENLISLNNEEVEVVLVVVNFKNDSHKNSTEITDMDFLLRVVQQISSEKICFPNIFHNQFLDINFNGDPKRRSNTINSLISRADRKIILGGNYNDFADWLNAQLDMG